MKRNFWALALLSFSFIAASTATAAPISPVTVTASSTCCSYNSVNLTNGSGLSGGLHDATWQNMWVAEGGDLNASVVFTFDAVYALSSISIWNYNSSIDLGRGVDQLDVFASTDNVNYFAVTSVNLTQGTASSIAADIFALSVSASSIRFDIVSNYGSPDYVGLSEVQFDAGVSSVPEPSTLGLLALGIGGIFFRRSKRRRA